MTASKFFGEYNTSDLTGFEKAPDRVEPILDDEGNIIGWDEEKNHYKKGTGIADLYKTNLLLLFCVPVVILILFCVSVFKLAKRLFEIVFLYLVMPFTISSIPLDDGSRFKIWRETIIAKTLSVYGTLVAFNLFFLFFGYISQIKLVNANDWVNTLFNVILIIGASLAACGGAELFVSLLGGNSNNQGSGFLGAWARGMALGRGVHTMGHIGRAMLTGSGGRGGRGGSGGSAAAGGIIGTGLKAAGAVATAAFGNKYTEMRNRGSNQYQNLKNILKGRKTTEGFIPNKINNRVMDFMDAGGLQGLTRKYRDQRSYEKGFEKLSKELDKRGKMNDK
jgi:hypothetical protein